MAANPAAAAVLGKQKETLLGPYLGPDGPQPQGQFTNNPVESLNNLLLTARAQETLLGSLLATHSRLNDLFDKYKNDVNGELAAGVTVPFLQMPAKVVRGVQALKDHPSATSFHWHVRTHSRGADPTAAEGTGETECCQPIWAPAAQPGNAAPFCHPPLTQPPTSMLAVGCARAPPLSVDDNGLPRLLLQMSRCMSSSLSGKTSPRGAPPISLVQGPRVRPNRPRATSSTASHCVTPHSPPRRTISASRRS